MEQITIAAVPYTTDDQARTAFGKVNPYKHGVLPVLVVIDNGTGKALRLDLKAEVTQVNGDSVEATPAKDVIFIGGGRPPRMPPNPLPVPLPQRKGPLNTWEIEGRAFSAKLLPVGDSVNGFFYFQTDPRPGSKLYLTGIKDAASGKEYFYFEIPLTTP